MIPRVILCAIPYVMLQPAFAVELTDLRAGEWEITSSVQHAFAPQRLKEHLAKGKKLTSSKSTKACVSGDKIKNFVPRKFMLDDGLNRCVENKRVISDGKIHIVTSCKPEVGSLTAETKGTYTAIYMNIFTEMIIDEPDGKSVSKMQIENRWIGACSKQ
jgi:hypothetical protein